MKYMKPRVVGTADHFIDRCYLRPILDGWVKSKQFKFIHGYLDLCKELG